MGKHSGNQGGRPPKPRPVPVFPFPIDRRWYEIAYGFTPSTHDCKTMFKDLRTVMTAEELAAVMGMKPSILHSAGYFETIHGRKLIWLYHSMIFHPWKASDWFNVLTWGRLAIPPDPGQEEDWDWCI